MINIKKLFTNILTKLTALETSKAPLASPALTGTPTAPTAAAGNNTTQIATTAFVDNEIVEDIFGRGEEIPANANLDNYTTNGTYYSGDSTRSATLTNPPTTGAGFKMYVGQITTAKDSGMYMYQLAIANTAVMFLRYKGAATAAWAAWKQFVTATVPVNQGGTGKTTFTSNAVLVGNGTSAISEKASANGALYATAANGALSWGTLPVAQGGSGRTGTGSTTTISDIATAGSGYSITTAQYAWWGKVAMLRLVVKKNSTAGSGTQTVATLVSGKRPRYNATGQWLWNNGAAISLDGAVQINGNVAADASVTITSTYILA